MKMNCDFIKTLTPEQKEELRKLINEDEQPQPKYRVEVEFYDKEKTKIKRLHEYLDDKYHGIQKGWYTSGQLEYELSYQNGDWHGIHKAWDALGQLRYKEYWLYGDQVSEEEYEKLSRNKS